MADTDVPHVNLILNKHKWQEEIHKLLTLIKPSCNYLEITVSLGTFLGPGKRYLNVLHWRI